MVSTIQNEDKKVEIKSLYKGFPKRDGSIAVLENISLHVKSKEFVVILGPSGCGKTTLLRIIAGVEKEDSGEILVDGKIIASPEQSRGMVFQSYSSFPWLTVHENIKFGLKLTNKSKQEQENIAREYLLMVGLKGFENYYPSQLSGGMKQRVAIARTLAVNPDILLLDEPFGALDTETRSQMQELLLDIWERNHVTVIFVTHDIEEALFLGDIIYICSPRPAKIKGTVRVDFQRPRSYNLRTKSNFNLLKSKIHSMILGQDGGST